MEDAGFLAKRRRTINAGMGAHNLTALRAALPRGARLIGLDPGRARIGVALSDVTLLLASPHGVLARAKLAVNAAEIGAIARQQGAGGLVVGLPLEMDGRFGPAAQAAKDWALAIGAASALPVALWDERLSSAAVNRALIAEADMTRAKRAARVDAAAAAWMLQAALDATRPAAVAHPD
jgi:putative Holliday junction resolvase